MAHRMHNETLDQQRRARQDFLDLKKMQKGEKAPEPKPSEVAILPQTPKEKWANFWFHYKWATIGVLALTVILAVLITQCATRVNYDLKVVVSCYTPLTDAQTTRIRDYLEPLCEDVNGDGDVHLQIINCSYSKEDGNSQYQLTMATRLQATLAADADALLFLTDREAYDYLGQLGSGGLFEGEPLPMGEDFYKTCNQGDEVFPLPEGLQISCRSVSGMAIERDPEVETFYKAAKKLLKAVEQKNK